MDRLCIFVVYDRQGIIDEYIEYILRELRKFSKKIIVVCNFKTILLDKKIIDADEILFRDNIGFDAGAYKEVFISRKEELSNYDEIIISNDTYYGPIYSFQNLFNTMENKKCDYWGITRHPNGVTASNVCFESHIQSYFLVFKRDVIISNAFNNFWKNILQYQQISDVILNFEVGINRMLENNGFIGAAYTDDYYQYMNFNQNIYITDVNRLVCECKVPILKRKCFELGNEYFKEAIETIDYIKNKSLYDVELIKNNLMRLSSQNYENVQMNYYDLKKFIEGHKKIFIYGNGRWGKNLCYLLHHLGYEISGIVVTKPTSNDELEIGEIIDVNDCGFIVAISSLNAINDVRNLLLNFVASDQIFLPHSTKLI